MNSFLFQIFYVDRVMINGKQLVKRQFPAFRGWTQKILKERQAEEKKFVSYKILENRSDVPLHQVKNLTSPHNL